MSHFEHIKHAAASDIGKRRKNNEDAFGVFPDAGVFCVADGMGGGDDGEVASAATVRAVEVFTESNPLPPLQTFTVDSMIAGLRAAVNSASAWIAKRAREKHLKGCGSTFAGVCFDAANPGTAVALHAGDSRLYRIRGKSIKQITKDHSAAELIGAKDENEINPMFRGMILRAVGIQNSVEVDATPFPVCRGDRVLICSDGLSKMLSDKRIASVVKDSATVDEAVRSLTDAANEAGGLDNITVVMLEIGDLPSAVPAVEMPTIHLVDNEEDFPVSDRHTLDTNAETSVSFSMVSSSGTTTSGVGDTVSTATSTMTIPEDDSEDREDGPLSAVPMRESPSGTETKAPESRAKGFLRIRLPVIVLSSVVFSVAVCIAVIGLTGGDAGEGSRQSPVSPESAVTESETVRRSRAGAEAEKARFEREAEAARKRAEEERAEAERIEAEKARKERARAEAEKVRIETEAEAAGKRAEAERAEAVRRQESERRRMESERKRAEAEKARKEQAAAEAARRRVEEERAEAERNRQEKLLKEKRERERAEKEKALAEKLAKEKELATLIRRRKAAYSALRRVCEDKCATAFVRKVMVLVKDELWDSICRDFRPVVSAMTEEASFKAASDLAREMQPVIVRLSEYADVYQSDAENELKDPLTTADYRKELMEVPAKMKEFRRNAARIIGKDVTDPDVHMACALMIEMVPLWF